MSFETKMLTLRDQIWTKKLLSLSQIYYAWESAVIGQFLAEIEDNGLGSMNQFIFG